jgi:isopentenyl-diphosphate delta-isomerase type 1
MEKLQAHQEGRLHRAISVCLFDRQGRWLLQRRALSKYHSPGLWSNSSCSHPRPGETTLEAASRRLFEELGVSCSLTFYTSFIYKQDVGKGLIEYEFDHLFIGQYDGSFSPNPEEVVEIAWWESDKIKKYLQETPSVFTKWFPIIVKTIEQSHP